MLAKQLHIDLLGLNEVLVRVCARFSKNWIGALSLLHILRFHFCSKCQTGFFEFLGFVKLLKEFSRKWPC